VRFGTSVRRRGCAGRSYPSHSTSRSPPTWRERSGYYQESINQYSFRAASRTSRRACPLPSPAAHSAHRWRKLEEPRDA
jgi:hypothetical protein